MRVLSAPPSPHQALNVCLNVLPQKMTPFIRAHTGSTMLTYVHAHKCAAKGYFHETIALRARALASVHDLNMRVTQLSIVGQFFRQYLSFFLNQCRSEFLCFLFSKSLLNIKLCSFDVICNLLQNQWK